TMDDVNVNAPAEQAPAMAPPTQKSQSNPIYKIAVDILKHTNFFRAFTASSTISSIYIQQFWDTALYVENIGSYSCQIDEQWFDLNKDTLQITPVDSNKPFSSPPTPDALINFVNDLNSLAVEESLKDVHATHQGPLPPMVFREPDFGRRQPLPEVTLAEVKTDTEELLIPTESGGQDEKQEGPDPCDSPESRPLPSQGIYTGSSLDPMDEGFIATAYPNVQENLKITDEEQVILEEPTSSIGTLSSLQHLAKDFSFGNQFFNDKPSKVENEKTTAETEAQSIVSVTIQQDSSAIPHMTTSRIGELEQIMANLIHDKSQLEERLDKHGSSLYKLENLDIPHQVNKAVDKIVTNAVDWAIQALYNLFKGQ
ncbi:hypothetical protein Tco_0958919, partial [Tanacetum coccineum]